MTKPLIAFLTLLCGSVAAETVPIGKGGDQVNIQAHGTSQAIVSYLNHGNQLSRNAAIPMQVEVDGVTIAVTFHVRLGKASEGYHEFAWIEPQDGFVAVPPEQYVADGETADFLIMLPMY